jgi:hypothetical protein
VGVALAGLHALWLPLLAGVLIVDESAEDCTHVWLIGGDRCLEEAARLYRQDPQRVILIAESPLERLVEMGLLPAFHELAQRELQNRNVPQQAIRLVRGRPRDGWQAARLMDQALRDQDPQVLVLCDRFGSRRQRLILNRQLSDSLRARFRVRGLTDRRYDETNWWKSRGGIRTVLLSGISLSHVWWYGEPAERRRRWDADTLEQKLAELVGKP